MVKSNATTISNLNQHVGQEVILQGWLSGKRSSGKIAFLQLRDGTGICQCVVEAAATTAFDAAGKLTQESSLELSGSVHRDERAAGGFEVTVTRITLLQIAGEYPIARKAHGIDFLMSNRHLWLRSRRPTAMMRIRDTVIFALREFFHTRHYLLVDTPILVRGAGEDAQALFEVDYFDEPAYLAQTGQLYLESAAMAYGKVYCFGPTFRAEKSKTRRHLTEFWMIEAEAAFVELDGIMELAEDMVCHAVEAVLTHNEAELRALGRDVEALRRVRKPFHRMTYSEAVDLLHSPETAHRMNAERAAGHERLQALATRQQQLEGELATTTKLFLREKLEMEQQALREDIESLERELAHLPEHLRQAQTFEWGKDLGGSDETILSRQFDKPVFVSGYPKGVKAFYMKTDEADPRIVRNMDLLAPEGYGEIIGGSQREEDLDELVARMKEKGLDPAAYDWYLDLRRYGSVPHSGFGLGIERTVSWICGLKHIREASPFPRTMGRIYP
jgi:asparaginyl-tRNA synthetase